MVFKNDESLDKIKDNFTPPSSKDDEMYDKDGDGQESVSEYIEKKKITSNAKNAEEENARKEKKNKNKEDLEKLGNIAGKVGNAVGNAASIIGAVPHFAAFGLGMGAGGITEKVAEKIKEMQGWK